MNDSKALTAIHYFVDTKPKKVFKKAKKLGYDTNYLSRGVAHFSKDDKHIVSIKGTDPLNIDDIKSDVDIALGTTAYDKQFNNRQYEVKKIIKKLPKDQNITLTGHSLGGSIATSILTKAPAIRARTDKAHLFNTGYTKPFHKELKKNITSDERKDLKTKILHHIIENDIVSAGLQPGSIGTVKTYEAPTDTNLYERHSLDAFD